MTKPPDLSLFERAVARQNQSSVPQVVNPSSSIRVVRKETLEPTQVIAASAAVVPMGDTKYAQELRLTRQPRQLQAFEAYETVGEIYDPCEYVGRALSMVRIYPCVFDEDGNATPDDDPRARALVQDLGKGMERGGMDGLSALMHDLAVQLMVAGEGFLIGELTEKGENAYDVLSISELALTGGSYQRIKPGEAPRPLSPDTFMLRIWQPSVRYSHMAISGVMVVLPEIETLKLLSDQMASTARSRLAASGVFAIPSEATKPPPKAGEVDPLTAEIIEHFITPAQNPRSAMGVAPYVLRLPGDLIGKIQQFGFDRVFDHHDVERITFAITRVAHGLEVPLQRVTGFGAENHWGGWLVTRDEWQGYLEPKCRLLVGALSRGWYLPNLEKWGVDTTNRGLWFDPTEFLVNPNRVQDAKDAHAAFAISDAGLREELGFPEDYAPSAEELARRTAIKVGDVVYLVSGTPSGITSTPSLPMPESPAGPENVKQLPPAPPNMPIAASVGNGHHKSTKPLQLAARVSSNRNQTLVVSRSVRQMSRALAEIDRDLFRKLTIEANAAVERSLEKAGARLRSRISGNSQRLAYNDMLQGLPNHLVAQKLGSTRVQTLGVEEDDLIDTTFTRFKERAKGWFRAAQTSTLRTIARFTGDDEDGLEEEVGTKQEEHRGAAIALLSAGLAAFAKDRLYTPEATPPEKGEFDGLLAPKDVIRDAMRVAGGGNVSAEGTDPAMSGVANGAFTAKVLADRNIIPAGYLWTWGGSQNPFPEHLDLDGVEVSDMSEFEPFFPGDHDGCSCEISPIWGEE